MIEVRALSKSFKALTALETVSFSAPDGQITGLLGPNGAGKTTLLRLLYTVLRPDAGTIHIDGIDAVVEARRVQARIGVLPDARGLYSRLTAREQIRYFGRLHGLGGAALEARIDDLAAGLGLADILDRRALGFSRGQCLKVALARALIHDPPNLLLDEPTNGLDIAAARHVRDQLRALRDQGRCILFCSHVMGDVAQLCDRLVVIAQGRVVAEGTVEELRAHTGRRDLEDVFLALTGELAREAAE